jgi:hypothetical protein
VNLILQNPFEDFIIVVRGEQGVQDGLSGFWLGALIDEFQHRQRSEFMSAEFREMGH